MKKKILCGTGIRHALAALAIGLLAACATAPREPDLQASNPHPRVRMETSAGTLIVELDREHAPISTDNFLRYVVAGQYDDTIFHRVIPGFVVQGGGFDPSLRERPTRAPIVLEAANGLSNRRGTIAMARETHPDSATDEFYFNLVDNGRILDPLPQIPGRERGYAVFGRVIDGMEVVDRIATVPTGAVGPFPQDAPLQNVLLNKAELLPAATP